MELDDALQGLITQLSAAQRRSLAREIATDLRRRQQRRIAAQVNPDGTPYAPKRPRLRRKGRVRNSLFARIRTTRYMRIEASAQSAVVQITGRSARIARVHQYGLTDRVGPKGPQYRYPRRELLGFAASDEDAVAELVLDHLTRAL